MHLAPTAFDPHSPYGYATAASTQRRQQFDGSDPAEAEATLGAAYDGTFTVKPTRAAFAFKYALLGNDRLTLRTSNCTGGVVGQVPHLRDYAVSWFRAGSGVLSRHRSNRTGGLEVPFLYPAEQPFGLDFVPYRQNLVHFAPTFLEDVATEVHSGPRQRVSFDLDADADPSVLDRWRQAVSSATTAIVSAATTPLVRLNAELALARALLRLFPWRVWNVPAVFREPSGAKARVALDYLQHHAHEPITPADAARAAGIHTRMFQLATQRHLGISPTVYLRNVRLDRVHGALLEHDPHSTTVSVTAREWGFGNLGRFSISYQERFGEKPNQTLRK